MFIHHSLQNWKTPLEWKIRLNTIPSIHSTLSTSKSSWTPSLFFVRSFAGAMTPGNAQLSATALAIVTWGVDIWFRRRSCAPPLPRFPLYSLRQYYKHAYRSFQMPPQKYNLQNSIRSSDWNLLCPPITYASSNTLPYQWPWETIKYFSFS